MRKNRLRRIATALGLAVFALIMAVSVVTASSVRELRIEDRCDAATFPFETGCQGSGGVTFQKFLAKLNPQDGGLRLMTSALAVTRLSWIRQHSIPSLVVQVVV